MWPSRAEFTSDVITTGHAGDIPVANFHHWSPSMPMLLRERGGRCAGEDMLHNRIFEGAWDSEINGPGRVWRLPSTAVLGSVLIIRGSDKIARQCVIREQKEDTEIF